jgi:hypothetical protein
MPLMPQKPLNQLLVGAQKLPNPTPVNAEVGDVNLQHDHQSAAGFDMVLKIQ